MKQKKKIVKAWAVVDSNNEIKTGEMLEQNYDCACQAFTSQAAAIFDEKSTAEQYRNSYEKVIKIEIHYSPITKKR